MKNAQDEIVIDGVTYTKCHIPNKAFDDCLTPCSFCASRVQDICKPATNPFCGREQVCYIDFNKTQD